MDLDTGILCTEGQRPVREPESLVVDHRDRSGRVDACRPMTVAGWLQGLPYADTEGASQLSGATMDIQKGVLA